MGAVLHCLQAFTIGLKKLRAYTYSEPIGLCSFLGYFIGVNLTSFLCIFLV